MNGSIPEFDFEFWVKLAATDPQAFEEKRREVIDDFIARWSPDQQSRLRGLQWRVDMERKKYRHPLAACSHLFNKMWASVYGEGGLSDALQGRVKQSEQSAVVLTFSPDRRARVRGLVAGP